MAYNVFFEQFKIKNSFNIEISHYGYDFYQEDSEAKINSLLLFFMKKKI